MDTLGVPVIETAGDVNYMSGMAICVLAVLWFLADMARHQSLKGRDMMRRFVGLALIVMSGWSAIGLSYKYSGLLVGLFFTLVMMAVTFATHRTPGLRMNDS